MGLGSAAALGSVAAWAQARWEVPWKFAKDVEDEALQVLVAEILDNEEVDLRDAVQAFNALSQEEREHW